MSGREWFSAVRRAIVFILGILVIVEGLVGDKDSIGELIVGAVMVGILPIDDVLKFAGRNGRERRNGRETVQRARANRDSGDGDHDRISSE